MRILIIEDEQEIRTFIKQSLESECFVVDAAQNGEEGSWLARTNEYDAIVLDNMLPGKSGKEVCMDIRRAGKTAPIIILSVKTGIDTKVAMLNIGADDYLTKPFSLDELLARIRALLRRPKEIKEAVLALGDLVLDTNQHTACRGAEDVYLTRKEFMLLEYLLRNQDAVVSRGMIMEHVWDMNADPFSNTIESHIRSLRKKIDFKAKKLIHTVPGRGYKIAWPD